jgi:hypothetical protein
MMKSKGVTMSAAGKVECAVVEAQASATSWQL